MIDTKYNFKDVTFVIPLRVDSDVRMSNLNILIKVLLRDYNTHIIILEADSSQKFTTKDKDVKYLFILDDDPIFHRTKYLNQLFTLSTTSIVAVWDTDAIAIPKQVEDAVIQIREGRAAMAFPYDGRLLAVPYAIGQYFMQTIDYETLNENINNMYLMHGYYSCGGAFLINKDKYLKVGGENENFYGWGPEDAERIRRMEIFNLPVFFASGFLFHLEHPRNGWFSNIDTEIKNRKAFLDTCKTIRY